MSNKRLTPLISNKESFDRLSAYTSDGKLYFNVYKGGEPGLWHNTRTLADMAAGSDVKYNTRM